MYRAAYAAPPAATITGSWNLAPENAYLAVDDILVVRSSATSTLSKSALITIAPTPVTKPKPVEQVRRQRMNNSKPISPQVVCDLSKEFLPIIEKAECIPVFADVGYPHTRERFISWLARFGWAGQPEDLELTHSTGTSAANDGLDSDQLQDLNVPLLIDMSKRHRDAWGVDEELWAKSGLKCPNAYDKRSGEFRGVLASNQYPLSVCFFSNGGPSKTEQLMKVLDKRRSSASPKLSESQKCKDGNETYMAVVSYLWMEDTVPVETRLRHALVKTNPELSDCEIENEIPEMAVQQPRVLRPISEGDWTAAESMEIPVPIQQEPPLANQEHNAHGSPSQVAPERPTVPNDSGAPGGVAPLPAPALNGKGHGNIVSAVAQVSENNEPYQGHTNAKPSPIPLESVTIGSEEVHPVFAPSILGSSSVPFVAIGSNIIALDRPAVIINGEEVSFTSKGLVIGSRTILVPVSVVSHSSEIPITIGTEQFTIVKDSEGRKFIRTKDSFEKIVGSGYLSPDGHKLELSGDSVIVDGSSTYNFLPSAPTAIGAVEGVRMGGGASNTVVGVADATKGQTGSTYPATGAVNPSQESKKKALGIKDWDSSISLMATVLLSMLLNVFFT
jgi:hypothetical protein